MKAGLFVRFQVFAAVGQVATLMRRSVGARSRVPISCSRCRIRFGLLTKTLSNSASEVLSRCSSPLGACKVLLARLKRQPEKCPRFAWPAPPQRYPGGAGCCARGRPVYAVERFQDVVVGAELSSDYAVTDMGAPGQDQDAAARLSASRRMASMPSMSGRPRSIMKVRLQCPQAAHRSPALRHQTVWNEKSSST